MLQATVVYHKTSTRKRYWTLFAIVPNERIAWAVMKAETQTWDENRDPKRNRCIGQYGITVSSLSDIPDKIRSFVELNQISEDTVAKALGVKDA